MTFIAGGYSASFAGVSLGQVEDGFELEHVPSYEDIRGDYLGDSLQDGVYRGGNMFINTVLLEFNANGAQAAFWPYSGTWGRIGIVGRLMSSMSQALVLTRNPAGTTATPASFSMARAIVPRDFNMRLLLAPRNRRVPLRLQLLPYVGAGASGSDPGDTWVWFTTA